MQNIEELALATYTRTVPLWLRYVDDTFTAVHKDGIDYFHEHLNRQNADIQIEYDRVKSWRLYAARTSLKELCHEIQPN